MASRQIFQIRQIVIPPAGPLVLLEICEIDEAHLNPVYFPDYPEWIILLETTTWDRGENLQPDGRHTHPDNPVFLQEMVGREIGDVKARGYP